MNSQDLQFHLSDESRRNQIRQLMEITTLRLGLPIMLLFWPIDCLHAPQFTWYFLKIRLLGALSCLLTGIVMRRPTLSLLTAEVVTTACVLSLAVLICILAVATDAGNLNSPYFEGLNLIVLAIIPFVPLRPLALGSAILAAYLPFLVIAFRPGGPRDARAIAVHLALMASTVMIAMVLRMIAERLRQRERQAEAKLAKLARQVAHDIRSPVAALRIASQDLTGLAESRVRLIRGAAERIDEIANDLLNRHTPQPGDGMRDASCLTQLLDALVSEKRVEHRSHQGLSIILEVDGESYSSFAKIEESAFKRAVSNIFNNAIEALDGPGAVRVRLQRETPLIRVSVEDTGRGMSEEVLAKVGAEGVTHGKSDGHGLGIAQARSAVESSGGSLKIHSELGKGTTIEILVPAAPVPEWFLTHLPVPKAGEVLSVDDEPFVHEAWKSRFAGIGVAHRALSSIADLESELAKGDKPWVLIDYQFRGSDETGLHAIARLGLSRAVLVTNSSDDPNLRRKCSEMGIRLIPKRLVHLVPFRR